MPRLGYANPKNKKISNSFREVTGKGDREKEGLPSKRLTASLKTYEITVRGEWQISQEPPERKGEIERVEGQRTGKHIHAGENIPGGEHT
eukprot:1155117-Pelagomonas_calceolata.AAC.2